MANAEELVNEYESRLQRIRWEIDNKGRTVGIDNKIPTNIMAKYHEPDTPCLTDIQTTYSSECSNPRHSDTQQDSYPSSKNSTPTEKITAIDVPKKPEVQYKLNDWIDTLIKAKGGDSRSRAPRQQEENEISKLHFLPTQEEENLEEEINLQNLQHIHKNWDSDGEDDDNIPSFYSESKQLTSDDDEWESEDSFGTNKS
ncbi:uncharacterized protein EV420DRAFT_1645201 [Desarmillaria tabescens]|uniref:Uncharacterized protein n=1 Tax=Armillaria tabescens TaxID=1929756 RepID=A0AA39K3M7_ARMTA|nr:uncharacterized protein EV420DRAFT_1645201 [Desarmillaria tabescens]KAK0453981.1 hypothetical protein EV420DRAFT_1645201 [Desarmillaria tabescens]